MNDQVKEVQSNEPPPTNVKNTILLVVYGGLSFVTFFITIGYMASHFSHEDWSMSVAGNIVLLVLLSINILLVYATILKYKAMQKDTEALTPKERLNRNILLFTALLGVIMSLIFFWQNIEENAIFSNTPIPTFAAILLAIIWAIVLPVIYIYWEKKATDEQEIYAYRTGAYYASHFYLIAAPLWWILWRGGLVPEPNGIAIFIIFNCIWSGIWLWKKYRG